MAKSEIIKIQDGDEVIELIGADKQAFLEQRAKDIAEENARQEQLEAQKTLKVSAYTKLGLSEEEINAIL